MTVSYDTINMDELFKEFVGKRIFVKKPDGYHYGTLSGYDTCKLSVRGYVFSQSPLDVFSYARRAFGSQRTTTNVPLLGITAVGEIPIKVRE